MEQNWAIALLDDDADVCSSMARLLRSMGLVPTLYESADNFLGSANEPCGCILSDVQMPGSSGLELLDLLVARGDRTPVILMTAFPDPQLRDLAVAKGAIALLEKPVDSRRLIDALTGVFGPSMAWGKP